MQNFAVMRLLPGIGIARFERQSLLYISLVANEVEAHEPVNLVIIAHAIDQVPIEFTLPDGRAFVSTRSVGMGGKDSTVHEKA